MISRAIFGLLVLGWTTCACVGAESPIPKDGIVLLISLGGFPASELQDPKVSAPTLRRLASEGASASRMSAVDPTVTWPNHAALATGVGSRKHGVLYNGIVVRQGPRKPPLVKPCTRAEILRAPTLYDLAHEAGLSTAQVSWPPSEAGGTISWAFGELSNSKGAIEREMMQAGTLTDADLEEVGRTVSPRRDDIWFRAVNHIIVQHHPNLMLLRLTDFDAITHKYGPGSPESRAAISAADTRVNQILELLKKERLIERTTLFVVSDQGFKSARRNIRPNAALLKAGLMTVAGPKPLPIVISSDAYALTAGGIAQLFLTNPARLDETRSKIKEIFSGMEGVERIIEPSSYTASGFPDLKENGQMSDLVLVAKPGYGFIAAADGEPVMDVVEGTTRAFHGYPSNDPDMDAIFFAWGQNIRPGVRIDKISNLDVAPTVAQSLHLKMEHVDGRVLLEILR